MILGWVSSLKCFSTSFPRVIGGPNDETSLDAIDVDSSSNIVAGGYSKDPLVLDATLSPNPIAVFVNYGGLYRWAKYF